jgi:acetyl esterase/lipase
LLSKLLRARGMPPDVLNQLANFSLNQLVGLSNGSLPPDTVDKLVQAVAGAPAADILPMSRPHQAPDTLRSPVTREDGTRAFYDIEYAAIEGFRPLHLDLYLPAIEGPAPVVAYIHGGAFRFGGRREGVVSAPIWKQLLGAGFAVAAIEYRLSGEATFPACVHDVHAAVRWLRCYADDMGLRRDAITAWGESAGAYLALFLGTNTSEVEIVGDAGVMGVSAAVAAVVAWYPPTDFPHLAEHAGKQPGQGADAADSPESLLVGAPLMENPQLSAFASPINHVSAMSAPTLLVHGDADIAVPYGQSVAFRDALKSAKVRVELHTISGAGHGFPGIDWEPLLRTSVDFLRTVTSMGSV